MLRSNEAEALLGCISVDGVSLPGRDIGDVSVVFIFVER